MLILGVIVGVVGVALVSLVPLFATLFGGEAVLTRLGGGRASRFGLILLKSLRRNPLRTCLTYLAVFVLVAVVTMVWSALYVLDHFMEYKARDIKVVISDRWQDNSAMPFAYARPLCDGGANPGRPDAARPRDAMTWQFYLGTVDPEKNSREGLVFFTAIEPCKAATLMDRTFDDVPQQSRQRAGPKLAQAQEFLAEVAKMENDRRAVIMGRSLLRQLDKRVGDRLKVTGINYKGIDLEVEIVGLFPPGRYDDTALLNRDYLNDALDTYPNTHGGARHPQADRSLNLVVLEVPDMDVFTRVSRQIDSSGLFQNPAVKCETLAAYAVSQLESYRDIIWGMRWLLAPATLVTLTVIIATGISISVRERRNEIAVLKILGYRPAQVLALVLGECLLLGALGGFLSSALLYQAVNRLVDNSNSVLPLYIPDEALWWGVAVGALAAVAGSLVPAWTACRVPVTAVLSRVG
jgi:putative ABC transport system permease protein